MLHSAGEHPHVIDVDGEDPDRRNQSLTDDRLDAAVFAISSPIGIEALPREAADRLIEAHLTGVSELGDRFTSWGPLALEGCVPDDVDNLRRRGCIGISIPAAALARADTLRAIGPVLARIAARGMPLFVHPGPPPASSPWEAARTEPVWGRALGDHVSQMQAAWLTFASLGRREHPHLVVVFARLAEGAPLLAEWLQTRDGAAIDPRDLRIFYDTSSYGPSIVGEMARRVGIDQLVYGSDRPVLEPLSTDWDAIFQANGARLLSPQRSAVTQAGVKAWSRGLGGRSRAQR